MEDCLYYIIKRLQERRVGYLNEMSTSWKDISRELGSSATKEILVHLVKLYYWSEFDREDERHWKREIYAFYHDIPKQRSNNKYPDEEKIFDTIWNYWGDTFDSIEYALNADKDYDRLPEIIIEDKVINFCKEYIQWLSKRLSITGRVTMNEVFDEIDKLMLEYDII